MKVFSHISNSIRIQFICNLEKKFVLIHLYIHFTSCTPDLLSLCWGLNGRRLHQMSQMLLLLLIFAWRMSL